MSDIPFNFEKEHPELYAKVQARRSHDNVVVLTSYFISVIISLCVLAVLINESVSVGALIFIMSIVSFTNTFTVHNILRKLWK